MAKSEYDHFVELTREEHLSPARAQEIENMLLSQDEGIRLKNPRTTSTIHKSTNPRAHRSISKENNLRKQEGRSTRP